MESNNNENNDTVEGGVRDDDVAAKMAAVNIDDESDDECNSIHEYDGNWLTEDVMVQLKNNDPTIKKVEVFFSPDDDDFFDAAAIDWERDGSAISENKHLKVLCTKIWNHEIETDTANAKAFCNALSKNRSIKHFIMERCPLEVGETFSLLTPFFKHNKNLRNFELRSDLCPKSSRSFVSALSECQSLRRISLHSIQCCDDDDSAEYVVSALGAHQNLRELSLEFLLYDKKWVVALGNILNKPLSKLRSLNLDYNEIGDAEASILGKALSKNRSLKKLSLSNFESSTSTGWAALFRGMTSSCSLEEISICYIKFGNEEALSFAAEYAIARNTTLKSLDMSWVCPDEQSITSVGWSTLFRSLLNPSSMLENLDLYGSSIDDIGVTALGDALANDTTLKILNLGSCESITTVGWDAFFQYYFRSNINPSLESINLERNNIDDGTLVALTAALFTSGKLKVLDLNNNPSISAEGWQTFFTTLQNFDLSFLEQLILPCNNISDTAMPSLISALTNARSLFRLNLGGNDTITPVGWTALSNILQRPNSSLADLSLAAYTQTTINDEVAISFANALINNKSLKTICFGGNNDINITARGWAALANVLCNKSSLESIYNSNHTLMKVVRDNINHDLTSYLRMNENDNKHEVARQKILKYHFADGDENIEKFVEMELAIIPYAIAWMGRDSTGHSLLYNVVRSLPTLFDSNAKKAKADASDVKE